MKKSDLIEKYTPFIKSMELIGNSLCVGMLEEIIKDIQLLVYPEHTTKRSELIEKYKELDAGQSMVEAGEVLKDIQSLPEYDIDEEEYTLDMANEDMKKMY